MINDIAIVRSHAPTNLKEIKKFEKLIQAKLPEDYKQFLLKHNGGHPIANGFELIKPINNKTKEAGIDWFYSLYDEDIANISTEFNNISTRFKDSRDKIPDEILPIGDDSGGKICLGIQGDYYGKLYYWTTNWSWWSEDDYNYLYLIANSFTDFINSLFERRVDDKGNFIRKYQDGRVTVTAE